MTCMPIRMGISRRPLIIRDPTFANELNRPASIRLLRRTIAAARAPEKTLPGAMGGTARVGGKASFRPIMPVAGERSLNA
jgi:hypothetical protein